MMGIRLSDLPEVLLRAEYAVRGPIVTRAKELERAGREIVYCNIGNPQALGQMPLSYPRRVLALCEAPELLGSASGQFPADAVEEAGTILNKSRHGLGAYSDSKGLGFVREAVAEFISERDSTRGTRKAADPEAVYLTDGASKGVQAALRLLISDARDGIMIPVPQYPLYSATITLLGGRSVGYYLDEASGWSISEASLEEARAKAMREGTRIRAICVINPGNPTGAVLDRAAMEMVIRFAQRHNLSILADEVYQANIYDSSEGFLSFSRVMAELDDTETSLFSFHSCSKGFLGECGQRGGYMEVRNLDADVMAQLTKLQSVSLCANLPGQVLVYLLVKPPLPGGSSYDEYRSERDSILASLARRARLLADGLNAIPGISCASIAGAMYAFPSLSLPKGTDDEEYCMGLLEREGVCVVPGTGFGQVPGSSHFRTTILPDEATLARVVDSVAHFHARRH